MPAMISSTRRFCSGVGSLILYKLVDATIGLRVTQEQEREGEREGGEGGGAPHDFFFEEFTKKRGRGRE